MSGDDPQKWLWSAEFLFFGGQQLWAIAAEYWSTPKSPRHPAAPGQFGPAFLLFGYAFENALKGVIVQRLVKEGTSVRDAKGKLVGFPTSGHPLLGLAKLADASLGPGEDDLLRRLEEHIKWAGRYPVKKDVGDLVAGQLVPYAMLHPETDGALVTQAFERVLSLYDDKHRRLTS